MGDGSLDGYTTSARNQASRPPQPEPALCAGWNEYLAKAGISNKTGISRDTPARARGLACSVRRCLAGGWLAEISADLREAVAHWKRVRDDALYKSTVYFTLF